MSKINRFSKRIPAYSIGLNVVMSGTKKMSDSEQDEHAKNEPDFVRVTIVDNDNPNRVLVNERVALTTFMSGNIGYKLHTRNLAFTDISQTKE